MVEYKYNQPYYKLIFSELSEDAVHVYRFDGEESISRLFQYRFELISDDPEINAADVLNKKATFEITRGEDDPIKIHGIISHFEQRGRTPDYVSYYAVLVPKMWRTTLNYGSRIFQKMTIDAIVEQILKDSGFAGEDFEFSLNESYPELEYCVQYRETDFNFINRRLEYFGIYYYFDHRDDNDVIVFTDCIDNTSQIEAGEDILHNPNMDPLGMKETVTELICQERVVTGAFKLKDYNYEFPSKNLVVESQIDSESPGTYYEYGDHFKDESEGDLVGRVRNEEIYCMGKIFRGKGDCRLFRVGFKYKLSGHYRADWNEEYLLTKLKSWGNQHSLFAFFPKSLNNAPTYENIFESMPVDREYRPPRITPIPRIPGIMTSKMESGSGDEYAFLDDQGRYKIKVPFDLSDLTNGEASRPIRLSQPYSGPGYGIHFPNHADTEIVWSCIDGNVDRPLGLGTVPNPSNTSPSTSSNKAQSVIRTAGQNELTFDDTTGSENIYLHGTKDWTIDIVNDKKQTIGHDETASVGNDRSRDVGNDESIKIGNDRTKSVGKNESESIGENKSISVGKNHSESIGDNASIDIGKNESISIGDNLTISVGKNSSESIGDNADTTIGKDASTSIGKKSTTDIGDDMSLSVGKNSTIQVGKNLGINVDKAIAIKAKDAISINSDKEILLKTGSASILLKKNGDITIKGGKITIKASKDLVMKGSKITQN